MPRIDSKKFYTSAIQKHGITAKGLNWNSKANQEVRFDTLLRLLQTELQSLSIADAGCGFGDFYIYMKKKKLHPKKYIGIDSVQKMCRVYLYSI